MSHLCRSERDADDDRGTIRSGSDESACAPSMPVHAVVGPDSEEGRAVRSTGTSTCGTSDCASVLRASAVASDATYSSASSSNASTDRGAITRSEPAAHHYEFY